MGSPPFFYIYAVGGVVSLIFYNLFYLLMCSDIPPLPELISITWKLSGKKNTLHWFFMYFVPLVYQTTDRLMLISFATSVTGVLLLFF